MFAGFDYGTSNCSIGVWRDPGVRLLPLDGPSALIASTLYAPKPELALDRTFERGDALVLDMQAQSFKDLRFGAAALERYLEDPTRGFFVRSPKSFLGAPGLNDAIRERFVGVVAAMMANVKFRAERALGEPIADVVIGRPVNFQTAAGATAENGQALTMLAAAAREAGFRNIAFLFEPMAAAMEYEARLDRDQTVLVIDIGGGTTDCSFVRVGPSRRASVDRDGDVLGHAGERIGGNDYDQALALACAMPLLGLESELRSGLPVPNTYFVDAVSTNDVNAQQRFYTAATGERLEAFVRESLAPELIARLARLREGRATYRLLANVERAKIEMTDAELACADLGFLEAGLGARCASHQFAYSARRQLEHLGGLVDEVVKQAGSNPDAVYLTGGMAKSPVVRAHLASRFDFRYIDSEHFTSVTEGLTIWARRLYA
jgi:hypothetical chaperone protein